MSLGMSFEDWPSCGSASQHRADHAARPASRAAPRWRSARTPACSAGGRRSPPAGSRDRAAARKPAASPCCRALASAIRACSIGMLRRIEQLAHAAGLDDLAGVHDASLSHISRATMPRLWVTKITATPVSCCNSFNRSRYCAWIVTSRLVVGSSAMIRRGPPASAIAPTMRWRMPPDIWCGYSRIRCVGEGMRTASSNWRTRCRSERPRML